MRTLWILLICGLLTGCGSRPSSPAFPEPESIPSVQLVEPAESKVPFGQPVDLQLRFTTKEPLPTPHPEEWLEPPVELLDHAYFDTMIGSDWQRDVSLTVAVYAVTNTPVFVSTPVIETPELTLPFVSLEVTSRLEDTEKASPTFGMEEDIDFRGPEALRRRKRNLWISAIVGGFLLIGIGILSWILSKREKPAPPPTPAHVIALQHLKELKGQEIWIQKDLDSATVALSLILRTYIENRFGIHAPELTTEEFLIQVEADAPWPEDQQAGLTRFFETADRIKYAGDRPKSEILEDLYGSVEQFVNATREGSE